jgi:hypothetical protein
MRMIGLHSFFTALNKLCLRANMNIPEVNCLCKVNNGTQQATTTEKDHLPASWC